MLVKANGYRMLCEHWEGQSGDEGNYFKVILDETI
jgi:hypothetical protein